jgi:HAMP domain-containing protein/tRNA A-37 threonylcarbamoyl transferase component Bud32
VKIVGRYQIQARIGQGAMANVYRAFDPDINRVLAIKVLRREYCLNPQFASRFLREARAAGALSHPNIVTIYDVGEIEGFPYIAMELLEGEPLDVAAQRIGRFPIADVIEIGCQLADALRYAHEQGVVHRDIKPSNISLGKDGRSIKILDFGIARLEQSAAEEQGEMVKTQVGQVVGTPRYMSPEQALGRETDGRSDLFSVGVLLYELITGRPAFDGSSAATLALQITQRDPAPIDAPDCPRGLQFVVEKLLSKRPEKRFATGAHLFEALQREKQAYAAMLAEGARRRLPLPAKLALGTTAITAVVLAIGVSIVIDKQQHAMERVALASGSSIVSFVAANAALSAAENLALPAEQRDWLPAQAFVTTASADPNVTQMLVVDHEGVIRAASSSDLIGAHYIPPRGQRIVRDRPNISVTTVRASSGERSFRFARPIEYAGRQVGLVDVSVSRTDLESAVFLTTGLLLALVGVMLAVVAALTIGAAQLVLRPVRRLKAAFNDAADGNLDFRISHRQRDEFGDLFNAFNAFVGAVQKRLEGAGPAANQGALEATTISMPANDTELSAERGPQWSR